MDIYTPPGWALEHGISGRIPAVDAGVDAIALHVRNDASRQHADEGIGIMLMEQEVLSAANSVFLLKSS